VSVQHLLTSFAVALVVGVVFGFTFFDLLNWGRSGCCGRALRRFYQALDKLKLALLKGSIQPVLSPCPDQGSDHGANDANNSVCHGEDHLAHGANAIAKTEGGQSK
jgi:hypothetical protein